MSQYTLLSYNVMFKVGVEGVRIFPELAFLVKDSKEKDVKADLPK